MAARFWVDTGTNSNWNASPTTNWAATSGSTTKVAVPGATDDVTFDGAGAGNSASVVSATITILSLTFTAGYTNTVTLNAVVTIAGNFTDNTAHTWAGASGITISAASTITSGGKTFPNAVTFSGANTKTLSGNWSITGQLTISSTTTINSGTLNIAGGFNQTTIAVSGTTTINLTGGTWTGGAAGAGAVANPITLTGNITLSSAVSLGAGGSLTYVSGTITTTGNTLNIVGSTTLNTAGIVWNNITIVSPGGTITNNSLLTATGTLTINALFAVTFAGTDGFTVANFISLATDNRIYTFANGETYTITTSFDLSASRKGALVLITSDHASNRVNFILSNTASVCNVVAAFTRIDASAGRPILSFNGTITDSPNVFAYTNVLFMPLTSLKRGSRRNLLENRNPAVTYL